MAVAVFLPWYSLSLTPAGIAEVQQAGQQVVSQYGNSQLQSLLPSFHAGVASLAGQQVVAVSAHQTLKDMSIVLLVLAGLALLDALLPLVLSSAVPDGAGRSLVLIGLVASACVAFRMIDRPVPEGSLVGLSLREGAWLALLGGLMMLVGGLWPRVPAPGAPSEARVESTWSGLSGWTPQA